MMKVYKASAGSGKTYTLAHSYINLLLSALKEDGNYKAYRNILAVTFTNKATSEMKERILKFLAEEGQKNSKVRDILIAILHDYSAFSISTIDRFFQQALRAFSRELGQGAAYQIELDRDSLISESMDRILDNLNSDDSALLGWLSENMADSLEAGEKFNVDEGLYEMGRSLKSEEHRRLARALGMDDIAMYDPARLKELREACRIIVVAFHAKVSEAAKAVMPEAPDRVRQWLGTYVDAKPSAKLVRPNATTLKATDGTPFAALWDSDEFRTYNTVKVVDKLIFTLGFAREFYARFDELLHEKNVLCLDESNSILQGIIDGSDAPFIYEKLGVRYNHFLLDEFQDTSTIQWENFLPLLRESEAISSPDVMSSLIVGDVKQSIYRWRNSDWTLLENRVPAEFPSAHIEALDTNWRSAAGVVNFNNEFFKYCAQKLGKDSIYADVHQEAHSTERGCVKVSFTQDQCGAVVDAIRGACAQGAQYGDIAIIVRGHLQGGRIADALISEGIPVISDDSLRLTSSLTVRRLLSLLHSVDSPDDKLGAYITADLGITLPANYHSLVDLCEEFVAELQKKDPERFRGEILYVQTFMDDLQNWVAAYGNNLKFYLQHFESKEMYVGSPESATSVRIITIHKSKGLEFPFVIFPYADQVCPSPSKPETHWCHLDAKKCRMPEVFDNIYPVAFTKSVSGTWFEEAAATNAAMETIDNLNLFYVCATRAEKQLHIISAEPSKTFVKALSAGTADLSSATIAQLLYTYTGGMSEWNNGPDYDFSTMDRPAKTVFQTFEASYDTFPKNPDPGRIRFEPSVEARDFFSEDGVSAGEQDKQNGIALHDILSKVIVPSDLEVALGQAVADGIIGIQDVSRARNLLSKRIAAHSDWFDAQCRVFNEQALINSSGAFFRPDRVVLRPDGSVLVVDYKFGSRRDSYVAQVRGYMDIYRKLGYPKVEGCLWFVYSDTVEYV